MIDAQTLSTLSLYAIAGIIKQDWKKVNYAAVPYLNAMVYLRDVDSNYGEDSGKSIVTYFLANASSYRGEQAKLIKAELKKRIK